MDKAELKTCAKIGAKTSVQEGIHIDE